MWSPDGKQVAYVSPDPALVWVDLPSDDETTLAGEDLLQETLIFTPPMSAAGYETPFKLAWSPDGKWIGLAAIRSGDQGSRESMIMLARQGEHHLLSQEAVAVLGLG